MLKPGLAHNHSNEFNQIFVEKNQSLIKSLIQSLNQSLNQNNSESDSESESEKNQSLIQSLNQKKIRVWFRVWIREIQSHSESVLNCFWETSWFITELLWKIGTRNLLKLILIGILLADFWGKLITNQIKSIVFTQM